MGSKRSLRSFVGAGAEWIQDSQDRDLQRALGNAVMYFQCLAPRSKKFFTIIHRRLQIFDL